MSQRYSTSSTSSEVSTDSFPDRSENTEGSGWQAPDPAGPSKASGSKMLSEKPVKRSGKRPGRKPSKIDVKAKLERSRQSARECRARKKLRYQYLEELVLNREQAIFSLRDELEVYKQWCIQVDKGIVTDKLINTITEEPSSKVKSMSTGQGQSYPRSRQTSTVTSGTQSFFGANTSGQRQPNTGSYGLLDRSRSRDQGSHSSGPPMSFPASRMASQLHGSGAQVHASDLQYPCSSRMSRSDIPQVIGSSMSITASDIEQYSRSQFGDNTGSMYSHQGQYGSSVGGMGSLSTDYNTPAVTSASPGYINLNQMNYPTTCTVSEEPVATLTSITRPSSVLPSYDMSVSYNLQPSTPQTGSAAGSEPSHWYSFLAELEPGLARQGAESASGTPQSLDGVRTLPTVLHDMGNSDTDSDT